MFNSFPPQIIGFSVRQGRMFILFYNRLVFKKFNFTQLLGLYPFLLSFHIKFNSETLLSGHITSVKMP